MLRLEGRGRAQREKAARRALPPTPLPAPPTAEKRTPAAARSSGEKKRKVRSKSGAQVPFLFLSPSQKKQRLQEERAAKEAEEAVAGTHTTLAGNAHAHVL